MNQGFQKAIKTALILVYLVIVAGALVRMTGSGMGCPDWPKCFGYYIPPTDVAQLTYTPMHKYCQNQIVIKDEKLWVAATDFVSPKTFESKDWRPYTRHDYAIFDATETWIEYLNRLVGALAGLAVFVMAILSLKKWKLNKKIMLLAWLTVLLMGFQGWLGARVVYSVLNPIKISIHMTVALIIVALLLNLLKRTTKSNSKIENNFFNKILFFSMLITIFQIILGTQVRQFVDEQVKIFGYNQMNLVFENPNFQFYVHRSFSILILLTNGFLWFKNRKLSLGYNKINWVMFGIFIEIITGVFMFYFDFPKGSQPIHLVIASLLFGVQFYLYLETKSNKYFKINQSKL